MTDGLPPFCVERVHDCHELIKNFANATANTVSSFRDFERHWKFVNHKLMLGYDKMPIHLLRKVTYL